MPHQFIVTLKEVGRKNNFCVSKLGGLCLYLAFTVTVLVAQYLPVQRLDPYEVVRLAGLLLGGTVIFAGWNTTSPPV